MKEKVISAAIAAAIALTVLTGCQNAAGLVSGATGSANRIISGDVAGSVGEEYSTQWFDFKITYIKEIGEYAGHRTSSGFKLYDVLISETGTFDYPIPMGTLDFYMDASSFEEYIFPIGPLDDTMMPLEFELAKDQTVEYHMIYEVPEGVADLVLEYTEVDEEETLGAVFTIEIAK